MNTTLEREQKCILELCSKGLQYLYKVGVEGNWGDVRSTSHAIRTLVDSGENPDSPLIQAAVQWLSGHLRDQAIGKSLESEIWDTALALIAFKKGKVPLTDPRIVELKRWLLSMKNQRDNWHDEPWETTLALWALLEIHSPDMYYPWLDRTLNWFQGLQDPSTGMIISFHYTAFFILVLQMCCGSQLERLQDQPPLHLAANTLLRYLRESGPWTNEAWSNGYILLALLACRALPLGEDAAVTQLINWFATHQDADGRWDDVEDTCVTILALLDLYAERQVSWYQQAKGKRQVDELLMRNAIRFEVTQKLTTTIAKWRVSLKRRAIQTEPDGSIIIYISPERRKLIPLFLSIVAAILTLIAFGEELIRFLQMLFATLP